MSKSGSHTICRLNLAPWVSLMCVLACFFGISDNALGQTLVPIIGTDYYCVHLPGGSTYLGLRMGNDVSGVEFGKSISSQRKKAKTSAQRVQSLKKLLKGERLSNKLYDSVKRLIKNVNAGQGTADFSKVERAKIKKAISKEESTLRLRRRQLQKILDCQEQIPPDSDGNVTLEFLSEKVVDPTTGTEKVLSVFYISTPYPKKIRKKERYLEFSYCTQFTSSEESVNALGGKAPIEGKIEFNNNLCSQPRMPSQLSSVDCIDLIPPKTIGAVVVARFTDGPLSDSAFANLFDTVSPVSHYIRRIPKTGCIAKQAF